MPREVSWFGLLALGVLPFIACVACTVSKSGEKATSAPEPTTAASAAPQSAFVRTCEMSVYGMLDASAWKKHSTKAGPLSFYYADQYAQMARSELAPVSGKKGYYRGQKLLVLVRPGAVVTVVLPESERRYAALIYNPNKWNDRNAYRIEDGQRAVTFKACEKGETPSDGGPVNAMTQFNGGFVVAGARCVPIEVFLPGQGRSIRTTLSFGRGRCAQ